MRLVEDVTIGELLLTWRGVNMATKNTRQNNGEVKQKSAPRVRARSQKEVVLETPSEVHSEGSATEGNETPSAIETSNSNSNEVNINSNTAEETNTMATFNFKSANKQGDGIYTTNGLAGTIRIAKGLLAAGQEFPASIEIDLPLAEPTARVAKVKETAEERKARLAAMTPQEKLDAQEARLKKQAENLAARRAKLFGGESAEGGM